MKTSSLKWWIIVCCLVLERQPFSMAAVVVHQDRTSQSTSDLEQMIRQKIGEKHRQRSDAATNSVGPAAADRRNDSIKQPRIGSADLQRSELLSTNPTRIIGSADDELDTDVLVRFNFADEEWKDVIEFIADQAGFGVVFGQPGPPQGTFSYFDSEARTILESLDLLNSHMALLQPPHVLVRNGTQLVLINESAGYPDHLIARVRPDDLEKYGQYEVVVCEFDLGNLDGGQMATELRENVRPIHVEAFSYMQSANRLTIRERVDILKRFREIIHSAVRTTDSVDFEIYTTKHLEPDSLIEMLKPLLGFKNLSTDPAGGRVILSGTPEQLDKFKTLAAKIDLPLWINRGIEEQPYFQVYRISDGDPKVIFEILQSRLSGERNVKMDQDSRNGNIYVEAPQGIHDSIVDLMKTFESDEPIDAITVNNMSPSDAIVKIEQLLSKDRTQEEVGEMSIVADSEHSRVLVYGTPQQINLIKKMVDKIDVEIESTPLPRRSVRYIPMSPRQQTKISGVLRVPDIMKSFGRNNRLNLILPEDRKKFIYQNQFK